VERYRGQSRRPHEHGDEDEGSTQERRDFSGCCPGLDQKVIKADPGDDAEREADFKEVPGRHAKQVVHRQVKEKKIDWSCAAKG
jgi:hypothetical protein